MNVLEVFTGNPFNTAVGQRIEQATDGNLQMEDWALNMEICDIINETDEGPRDAVRAIRKRFSNCVGKEWRSVSYALTVLETCVKNCGKRFHIQVASKDFLAEMVKIISPKNDPSVAIQEKVLSLIQTWADAFRGCAELRAVEQTYQELKSKGIEFPLTDLDSMAPIHTPKGVADAQLSSPVRQTSSRTPSTAGRPQASAPPHKAGTPPSAAGPVAVGSDHLGKLRSDLEYVQGNCRIFNEMLNANTQGGAALSTDNMELMRELNRTCRQMQQRIVVLIEQVADEQVTEVLLRVNDDLNNAFLRYDRLERYVSARIQSNTSQSPPTIGAANSTTQENAMLIDLGVAEPRPTPPVSGSELAAHLDQMSVQSKVTSVRQVPAGKDDEFDVFAQSRQFDATRHDPQDSYAFQQEAGATYSLSSAVQGKSNPYRMENEDSRLSATSVEFDRFLAERVAAGESQPDKGAQEQLLAPPTRGSRQMKKDDSENTLFAL